jgi:hypothetical protein
MPQDVAPKSYLDFHTYYHRRLGSSDLSYRRGPPRRIRDCVQHTVWALPVPAATYPQHDHSRGPSTGGARIPVRYTLFITSPSGRLQRPSVSCADKRRVRWREAAVPPGSTGALGTSCGVYSTGVQRRNHGRDQDDVVVMSIFHSNDFPYWLPRHGTVLSDKVLRWLHRPHRGSRWLGAMPARQRPARGPSPRRPVPQLCDVTRVRIAAPT